MRFADGRLLVCAKAPILGQVKTRLMPELDAQACARLQTWLIERTLMMTADAALCPVELWCAPDCTHPAFLACKDRFAIEAHAQQGADLGARMRHALSDALARAEFAVLIGCDCPALSAMHLAQACALLADGVPVVLGPAEDGGYALIGAHRTTFVGARGTAPDIFAEIDWGTAAVLAQTRARLREIGWRWRELETLWDIDRPADLARLHAEFPESVSAYSIGHSRQPPAING